MVDQMVKWWEIEDYTATKELLCKFLDPSLKNSKQNNYIGPTIFIWGLSNHPVSSWLSAIIRKHFSSFPKCKQVSSTAVCISKVSVYANVPGDALQYSKIPQAVYWYKINRISLMFVNHFCKWHGNAVCMLCHNICT